jgi:hypothetical protein
MRNDEGKHGRPKKVEEKKGGDLDRPLWGAEAIGLAANILDEDGNVDQRATYYALENGYIDASKAGRQYVSTERRILRSLGALPRE